jgi:predicted transposase/invertase (TIGR01784 family)
MVAEKEPGVKKAVGVLMELSEDERNQMIQDARDRWLTDHKNAMNHKYRLGKAEGIEEGKEIGREEVREELQQKQMEIARKLKARGTPLDHIAEDTGLSLEEITAL